MYLRDQPEIGPRWPATCLGDISRRDRAPLAALRVVRELARLIKPVAHDGLAHGVLDRRRELLVGGDDVVDRPLAPTELAQALGDRLGADGVERDERLGRAPAK